MGPFCGRAGNWVIVRIRKRGQKQFFYTTVLFGETKQVVGHIGPKKPGFSEKAGLLNTKPTHYRETTDIALDCPIVHN